MLTKEQLLKRMHLVTKLRIAVGVTGLFSIIGLFFFPLFAAMILIGCFLINRHYSILMLEYVHRYQRFFNGFCLDGWMRKFKWLFLAKYFRSLDHSKLDNI